MRFTDDGVAFASLSLPVRILNYGRPPAFVKGYGFKENLMQRIEKQPYEEEELSSIRSNNKTTGT